MKTAELITRYRADSVWLDVGANIAVSGEKREAVPRRSPAAAGGFPHAKAVRLGKPFSLAQNLAAMEKPIWGCG